MILQITLLSLLYQISNMKPIKYCLIVVTFMLMIPISSTFAQETQSDNSISISPSMITVDENDLGKTYEIQIKNNTDRSLTMFASERFVRRKEGKIVPVEIENPGSLLEFNQDDFVIAPNQEYLFKVRIKLSIDKFQAYPSISFSESEPGNELSVGAELLTVFLLQDFDGTLLLETNTTINQPNIALNRTLNIFGTIKNSGEKYFDPAGTVKVFRNETLLFEKQVTTQIEGWLFPEESKEFSLTWENDLSIIDSLGNYTIETSIQSYPYSRITTNTINFFFIPSEVFIYGIPFVAGLVVCFLLIRFIHEKLKIRSYFKNIS